MIYQQGCNIVDGSFDIVNVLKTIEKLKSGLSAIIGNDVKLINDAKEIYLNHTTIYPSDEDNIRYLNQNKFEKFLELGDRKVLIDYNFHKQLSTSKNCDVSEELDIKKLLT